MYKFYQINFFQFRLEKEIMFARVYVKQITLYMYIEISYTLLFLNQLLLYIASQWECENVTLRTAINMCRTRSNRTDEWRPFLARNAKGGDSESQEDRTGDKRRGVKETRRNKRRETGDVSRNRVRFARVPRFS